MTLAGNLSDAFQKEAENGIFATEALDHKGLDLETVERTRELLEFIHNESIRGVGPEHSGVILSAAAFAKLFERLQEEKKEEESKDLIRTLDMILEDLDNMIDDMSGMIDDMRENDRKIRKGIELLKEDDLEGMHIFLLQEYGIDTTDMTDDQIRDKTIEVTGDTIYDQEQLAKDFKKTVEEYKLKTGGIENEALKEEYDLKLDEIELRAKQYDLDFDGVLEETRDENRRLELLRERLEERRSENREQQQSFGRTAKVESQASRNQSNIVVGEEGKNSIKDQFSAKADPVKEESNAPEVGETNDFFASLGIDAEGDGSTTAVNVKI